MRNRLLAASLVAVLLALVTDVAGAGAATAAGERSSSQPAVREDGLRWDRPTKLPTPEQPIAEVAPEQVAPLVEVAPEPAPEPVVAAPSAAWPVDRDAAITDFFGPREAPTAGASTYHRGVDFAPAMGAPVYAAASGVVTEVVTVDSGGCGIEIVIQHTEQTGSVSSRYCHLLEASPLIVVGTPVEAGQHIAGVGSTGVSTGAHLHFEVRLPDGTAIDPLPWLDQHTTPSAVA